MVAYRGTTDSQYAYRFIILQNSTFLTIGSEVNVYSSQSVVSTVKCYASKNLTSPGTFPANQNGDYRYDVWILFRNAVNNNVGGDIHRLDNSITSTSASISYQQFTLQTGGARQFDAAVSGDNTLNAFIGTSFTTASNQVYTYNVNRNSLDNIRVNNIANPFIDTNPQIAQFNRLKAVSLNKNIVALTSAGSSSYMVALIEIEGGAIQIKKIVKNIPNSGSEVVLFLNYNTLISMHNASGTRFKIFPLTARVTKATNKNATGIALSNAASGTSAKVLIPK
jgi:hypothetical protein